jgi:hypothetical protein
VIKLEREYSLCLERGGDAVMTIEDSIAVSLNVSLRNRITGMEIVDLFKTGALPEKWRAHFEILFSEIPPSRLSKFFDACGISTEQAQKLYSLIPGVFHNARMGEFLFGNLGKTA